MSKREFGGLSINLGLNLDELSGGTQPTGTQPTGTQPTGTSGGETSSYNKGQYTDMPIAQVPSDPRASATSKQLQTMNMYTTEDEGNDLNRHGKRQNQIVDDFAMTPEQWYKMYGYWNWNLAKNNPNGNLNNRSFNTTLSQSRLADAFNNQRHWRAAKIGRRTNSGFGTNEYQEGYSEKWQPIETQEMRQMRADERLDEQARSRQVNRAENIQDYPLELQKMADKVKSDLTRYASQTGIDLQRTMQAGKWNAEYGQSWSTYWSNFMNKFSQELSLDIRDRVMTKISQLKYPFSQIYASLSGGMAPNPAVMTAYQYLNALTEGVSDPKEAAFLQIGGLSMLSGMLMSPVLNGFNSMFNGALPFLNLPHETPPTD